MNKYSVQVEERTFEKEVLEADLPVLVDFWASWCGPCRAIAPFLEEIAHEKEDVLKVAKVDIDENPNLARKYGVLGVPYLAVIKNGEVVHAFTGAKPKALILKEVEAYI